jgi:hypothetical protein
VTVVSRPPCVIDNPPRLNLFPLPGRVPPPRARRCPVAPKPEGQHPDQGTKGSGLCRSDNLIKSATPRPNGMPKLRRPFQTEHSRILQFPIATSRPIILKPYRAPESLNNIVVFGIHGIALNRWTYFQTNVFTEHSKSQHGRGTSKRRRCWRIIRRMGESSTSNHTVIFDMAPNHSAERGQGACQCSPRDTSCKSTREGWLEHCLTSP